MIDTKLIKRVYRILTSDQRRSLLKMQVLIIVAALTEVLSIASIGPFLALSLDGTLVNSNNMLGSIYLYSGVESVEAFIRLIGTLVLCLFTINFIFSLWMGWSVNLQASRLGSELSSRLFKYYLSQEWKYHLSKNSNDLIQNLSGEASAVADFVIQPMLQINAKLMFIFLAMIGVLSSVGTDVVFVILFLVSIYSALFLLIKKYIRQVGVKIIETQVQRLKTIRDSFGGIRDILLLSGQLKFHHEFSKTSEKYATLISKSKALSQLPRYIVEFVVYVMIVTVVLYIYLYSENGVVDFIPLFAVYAVVAFKLLPAFFSIYNNAAMIAGSIASFYRLEQDLLQACGLYSTPKYASSLPKPFKTITVKNMGFKYDLDNPVLHPISFDIKSNTILGLVGYSGAGKSTLGDLLSTLLTPTEGSISIDGIPLDRDNIKDWRSRVGYISQAPYIFHGTIAENIVFGCDPSEHEDHKIWDALEKSQLHEFVLNRREGLEFIIEEGGRNISGGQRQRLSIARALYRDTEILILDEATSALDGHIEQEIMNSIIGLAEERTIIIIAHRLKTLKSCDNILFLNSGKIIDQGTYYELIDRNEGFRSMSEMS